MFLIYNFPLEEKQPKAELKKSKPRRWSAKKPVPIEHRLKSPNTEYNFKWNQPCLNRVSYLRHSSNSFNLASDRKYIGFMEYFTFFGQKLLNPEVLKC